MARQPASVAAFVDQLQAAAKRLDEPGAQSVCEQLRDGIVSKRLAPDPTEQEQLLRPLQGRRWFALLKEVAEALLQVGRASPSTRRRLGQALIELGALEEALAVLQSIDGKGKAKGTAQAAEQAEAQGLIGRVYKQIYVGQPALPRPARRMLLEQSVRAYLGAYRRNPRQNTWQGINAVAMLVRGERDGIVLDVGAKPLPLARTILAVAKKGRAHWDLVIVAEACLALDRRSEARKAIERYVVHGDLDAFAAASTLRQWKEVWQLRENGPDGELVTLLQAAATLRQPRQVGADQLSVRLSLGPGELQDASAKLRERGLLVQRVLGHDGFRSLEWMQRCLERAKAVGRMERLTGEGFGSAFLVRADALLGERGSKDELLLLTNSHVMGHLSSGAFSPTEVMVRFEALDARRTFRVKEILFESPIDKLDVTVARLDATVAGVEPFPIAPAEPLFDAARPRKFFVIGHPGGRGLSLSLEDTLQVGYNEGRLHYRTPTEQGSSGSPVFDESWQLVAIHHAGSDSVQRLDGQPGTYRANEGIWIQSIIAAASRSLNAPTPITTVVTPESLTPRPVRFQRRSGVFISYAHADANWLDRLKLALTPLKAESKIEFWDDSHIVPGSDWLASIRAALDRASVAILLVSTPFMASRFIREEEVPRILEASATKGLTILPLSIGAALVSRLPAPLAKVQFANDPAKPLDELGKTKRGKALVTFAERLSLVLDTGALLNCLQAIDSIAHEATGTSGTAEPFEAMARLGDRGIEVRRGTSATTLVTFDQIARLSGGDRQKIQTFDEALARQLDLYADAHARGVAERDKQRRALCAELNRLLDFLVETLHLPLDDHYLAPRSLCADRAAE